MNKLVAVAGLSLAISTRAQQNQQPPPAYLQGRQALSDVSIGGQHIERGNTVLMSQWVIHHDPRFYEAPAEFRPERWLDGLAVHFDAVLIQMDGGFGIAAYRGIQAYAASANQFGGVRAGAEA